MNADFCTWVGVSCAASGVTVFLGSSGVSGTLPEIAADVDGSQVQLFRLDISNSPGIIGTLPPSWSRLTHLVEFVVSRTSIGGTIPAAYNAMTALAHFLVFDTKISGTLPSEWAGLPNLQYFAAMGTQIFGSIPSSWHKTTRLKHFLVHETSLSGTLPASWGNLTEMELFAVMRTSIKDALPAEWGAWSNVRAVHVEETEVSGSLPLEWSGMAKIMVFSAAGTLLTGTIPGSWGDMRNLKSVTLSDTEVTCCPPYKWVCNASLTTEAIGLTSQASSSCPTTEQLCIKPESSYVFGCPAHTKPTTTSSSSLKFPWWSISLIVLMVVAIFVVLLVVLRCCCGFGCGCVCCPHPKSVEHADNSFVEEDELPRRQRQRWCAEDDAEDQTSRSFVVESAPSITPVVSIVSEASVISVRTQPATKLNPFMGERLTTQRRTANAFESAADEQCQTAGDEDAVLPFSDLE